MSNICVSIITICYNAETLIEKTMVSVLRQDYSNIEYILVDGGSKDKTIEIIKSISAQYGCDYTIKLISEPDQGISDAMNKGVHLATGKIITHLHAGDVYLDSRVISKVVDSYTKSQWRWGVAGSIVVDKDGIQRHEYRARCADVNILLKKNCIPHQSTFLVKDIFDKNGVFRIDYKQAMDYEFWLRIAFQGGEKFTILPFNTTLFLDGGRSADIYELLSYLYKIRKTLRTYGRTSSSLADAVFLTRVYLFYWYYKVKKSFHCLIKVG